MTKNIRIIPRLDIKGPNLVKGIHLEGLRVLGKPWDYACMYYEDGADELIYIDVVASLYGRNNLSDIVEKTARNIFIPLTVGGGIRSVDDIRKILRAGADKVAINTAAVHNPALIKEGAKTFGSQCIVISIQAKRIDETYRVFTDNGREMSDRLVLDWVKEAVDLGAGEILLTSIDREGTGTGFDIELLEKIAGDVPVPVIACGGCGTRNHARDAVETGKADAICASSIFHYHYLGRNINEGEFREEGNIEFIKRNRDGVEFMSNRIKPVGIAGMKSALSGYGIPCRKSREAARNEQ